MVDPSYDCSSACQWSGRIAALQACSTEFRLQHRNSRKPVGMLCAGTIQVLMKDTDGMEISRIKSWTSKMRSRSYSPRALARCRVSGYCTYALSRYTPCNILLFPKTRITSRRSYIHAPKMAIYSAAFRLKNMFQPTPTKLPSSILCIGDLMTAKLSNDTMGQILHPAIQMGTKPCITYD